MPLNSLPLAAGRGAEILPLAGDASFRRYFRVVDGRAQRGADGRAAAARGSAAVHRGRRMAGVDAASARPKSSPAISTRACCCSTISATRGCARRSTTDPARERELYELATDVLVHLHEHPPMAGLPPHGLDQWLDELKLFTDWYCPAVGADVDVDAYRAAWREVLEPVANDGLGPVTVLRDYHAENIMLVEGRDGVAPFRAARFPGRARRPSRLRSRLGARGCAARRAADDRAGDDRPLRRRDRPRRSFRARLLGARGAAQHADPRRLHAAVEARRQARTIAASSRACGACSSAISRSRTSQPVRDWFDANIAPEHRREPWKEAA